MLLSTFPTTTLISKQSQQGDRRQGGRLDRLSREEESCSGLIFSFLCFSLSGFYSISFAFCNSFSSFFTS